MKKEKIFLLLISFLFFFSAGIVYSQEEEISDEEFEDIMEGEGLTLESVSDPAKEAVSGVSVVMEKEQIVTTSQIGLVEDVMSSVKTLPGVTYNGGFSSEPSIRGGYPREMSTVLDGMYVFFPWHWGGAYSIFNPHMVDSVKMSNGVFSARYGRALSGLLEFTTIQPKDEFHIDFNITSIATDLFAQIPINEKAGLFVGGKVTYMEGYIALAKQISQEEALNNIKTVPYIRDFYAKAYFNPSEKLTFNLNAFYGSDGICYGADEIVDFAKDYFKFDYGLQQALLGLTTKWLISSSVQLKFMGGYNWFYENLRLKTYSEGYHIYNDDFLTQYGHLLDSDTRAARYYYLKRQDNYVKERILSHQVQGKLETNIDISENHQISIGAEEVWNRTDTVEDISLWAERTVDGQYFPDFVLMQGKIKAKGNNLLNSSGYALWAFGGDQTFLSGEAGLRVDHVYIFNKKDHLHINTRPNFNPRASIQITPWRNTSVFDKVTFSAGCGLFSNVPLEMNMATKQMDIDDFDIKPNHAVFGVLGSELAFAEDCSFKLEGYYKYYLKRLFIVADDSNPIDVQYDALDKGKGIVYGFDLMLEKKRGEHWDGYLSYSFVNARFKNPYKKRVYDQTSNNGDPLDEWYYPAFHRFHTLNGVLNLKPDQRWTFTIKGTLASGAPKQKIGSVYTYPVKLADGTIQQRYSRKSVYSDVARYQISCPIDVRLGFKNPIGVSKRTTMEWYIGAENIFASLYSPKGQKTFNANTGEESSASTSADFNIGIPIISAGVKFSY